MPDYKVTFRGDLGNLHQFDSAVRNSALASARAVEAANQRIASSVGKITGIYSSGAGQGLFVQKQKTIADSINNTFRQSGEVVRRFVSDYKAEIDSITGKYKATPIFDNAYLSSYEKAIGNIEAYQEALKRTARSEKELLSERRRNATAQAKFANQREELKATRKATGLAMDDDQAVKNARANYARAFGDYSALSQTLANTPKGTRGIVQLRKTVDDAKQELNRSAATLEAAERPFKAVIDQIDKDLARIPQAETRAAQRLTAAEKRILRRSGFKDLAAASQATPPIQADLARALSDSPELKKRLIGSGLGLGQTPDTLNFQRALAQQEAAVTSYTRNLRTNVRTVAGEFRDAQGLMSKFTVDLDENGKVMGRWGGQLSGTGSVLRQTVRDFQKVIEWTVATTVVFGSLAAVAGQLQNINELNTSLTRFSITAQTTVGETNQIFRELAQVAFNTATPLNEIITVADDIALATRNASQSTEEWHRDIIDLTTAVGIFTNLTGKDTVAAADQLSSAFKQLGIAPAEIVTVLNKVTAVAGGQANAIADIVQSVSGLAEAAKAAGFSVDEQIAGVQVLAQVTNKTSAEIATAFKNLFGSVSSVGSEKILSQFGIQVRDAEGGIRDFLDIYRDVANAVKTGIIPQNRLPDVLRGISGGPRRAPDAAALLANLDRIDEVIQKSQGATNEALIANAKVLTTNQAKIIQFQNAIDTAVFERFGEAVNNLTQILTNFGIGFAGVLSQFNPELVTTITQIGLLVAALLALQKVTAFTGLNKVIPGLVATAKGYKNVATEILNVSKAQRLADERLLSSGLIIPNGTTTFGPGGPAAAGTRRQRFTGALGRNTGNIGRLAGAAALGVGAAAVSGGGFDWSTLGTVLQVGGGLATLSGALAPLGIAAIAVGTGMQFLAGNTDKAKESSAQLSEEVYTLTQRIQDTQTEANNYAKAQKDALAVIKEYQGQTKLSTEEQAELNDATTQYATATLGLAAANRTVSDSFDDLLAKIPGLSQSYRDLAEASRRNPNDPNLILLEQKLAQDILKNSGQAVYSGAPIPLAQQYRDFGSGPGNRDLSNIIENPDELMNLLRGNIFKNYRGYELPQFQPQSEGELRIIQNALSQLIEQQAAGTGTLSEDQLAKLIDVVTQFSQVTSSFAQNATALTQQAALIQAKIVTGRLTGEQGANALANNAIAQALNSAASQTRGVPLSQRAGERGEGQFDTTSLERAVQLQLELATAAEKGKRLSNNFLVEVATNALQLNNTYESLKEGGDAALNKGILQWLQEAGVAQEILDQLAKKYNITLQQTAAINDTLSLSIDKAKQSAAESYGQRQLQLEIAQNSGQYEDNAKGLAILKAQNDEAYQSTIQLIDGITALSNTAFVDFNNTLSEVIGLQGIYISQTELNRVGSLDAAEQTQYWADRQAGLAQQLIDGAVAAGVNAEGIQKVTDKATQLIAVLAAIPEYKRIIIQVDTAYRTLGTQQHGGFSMSPEGAKQYLKAKQDELEAINSGTDPSQVAKKIIDQINKIIRSGAGSSLGSIGSGAGKTKADKTTPYNKPGLLDVPEEIVNAANRNQLISQAVAMAKKLQSIVPGEANANKTDIVELLNGTHRLLETRGIGEEYLRRAMDELTEQIKKQNELLTKADTIRRTRVLGGSFAAIANVPVNSLSGVSVGSQQGPIDVQLNLTGQVLTPAQFAQFADLVAAAIKRQLAA